MSRRVNQHQEVQRDVNMWVDAMQADRLLKHLLDSLGRAYDSTQFGRAAEDSSMSNPVGTLSKAAETINRYVAKLASKYTVEVYFDRLKNVGISSSNMVTRRYLGFGGSMMAVPMLLQLWDWLDTWEHAKKISP